MRLLAALLLLGCSGQTDDPTCQPSASVSRRCAELGHKVRGLTCGPDAPLEDGCTVLEDDPGLVDVCCYPEAP